MAEAAQGPAQDMDRLVDREFLRPVWKEWVDRLLVTQRLQGVHRQEDMHRHPVARRQVALVHLVIRLRLPLPRLPQVRLRLGDHLLAEDIRLQAATRVHRILGRPT